VRAVVKAAPGPGLEMRDVPRPEPGPGEILLQVKAASICGTDLHIRDWDPWAARHVRLPLVVGHEMCGRVVEHGEGAAEPALGSLVSVESHVICGRCSLCRTGNGHLCPTTEILGVHRSGVFADYVVVPAANAWPDPPEMPYSIASLQENFGNAVHIMAIAAARALGARSVYATDVSDYRLRLARTMGAEAVFNPALEDTFAAVMGATEGDGIDVLLEMSGAPEAAAEGFRLLKPGGSAALLGLFSEPILFDLDDAVIFKGATVHGIVGRRLWGTWLQMRAMLRSGAVDLAPLVTHRFAFDDFEEAFRLMASGECGKVVLFLDPADADGPLFEP
jgi:threonine 3-dehydrogenase